MLKASKVHSMNFTALLNTITTVFAWVPSAILLFLALFGVVNVTVNWDIVSGWMFAATCLIALGAASGFAALTALCWQLKLAEKWQIAGLVAGTVTLTLVIAAGMSSQHEILRLGLNWVDIYLFVMPLLLGLLQLLLLIRK